jgi:hypothetical protein
MVYLHYAHMKAVALTLVRLGSTLDGSIGYIVG